MPIRKPPEFQGDTRFMADMLHIVTGRANRADSTGSMTMQLNGQ